MEITGSIIGAIVGAVTGGLNFYAQKRQLDREKALAEKQYQATKQAYENEAQEREKANGKEPDIDSLLASNTSSKRAATDLTGGKPKKTKLFNRTSTLGGGNGS